MAMQAVEEELLQHWFPATEQRPDPKPFAETDISEISTILERADKAAWSRIPRIYIVLRLIGRLDAIEALLQQEISDAWLPFTSQSLPEILRAQPSEFIDAQKLVFNSKAFNLEREGARHGHFRDANDVPLKKTGDLGKGASGFVERVISTITHREYALKLIKRGKTFRKDKTVLRDFEKELSTLKRLSQAHMHIIDLIGSYTEPKYVGILFPVADCNLSEFLERPDLDERRWALRTYFGCLASALGFLHDHEVRHKDIKPQNILVKDNQPYFTDFGLAVDWSEVGHSTTQGPTGMTPRYCAPEVVALEPRNSSSDVWSLGCVFLEIWAVLKHTSIKDLATFTTLEGRILPYHSENFRIDELIDHIKVLPGPESDSLPSIWIRGMLVRKRHDRWPAQEILDSIRAHGADPTTRYLYVGRCCLDDEDTAESVVSYVSSDERELPVRKRTSSKGRKSTGSKDRVVPPELPAYSTPFEELTQTKNVEANDQPRVEPKTAPTGSVHEAGPTAIEPDLQRSAAEDAKDLHPQLRSSSSAQEELAMDNGNVQKKKRRRHRRRDSRELSLSPRPSHQSQVSDQKAVDNQGFNPARNESLHNPALPRPTPNSIRQPSISAHSPSHSYKAAGSDEKIRHTLPRPPSPSYSTAAASSLESYSGDSPSDALATTSNNHARKIPSAVIRPSGSGFIGAMKRMLTDSGKDTRKTNSAAKNLDSVGYEVSKRDETYAKANQVGSASPRIGGLAARQYKRVQKPHSDRKRGGQAQQYDEEKRRPQEKRINESRSSKSVRSVLAGLILDFNGHLVDKNGIIVGHLVEGYLRELTGRKSNGEGLILGYTGNVSGRCELIPQYERETKQNGPFAGFTGPRVGKGGFVEDAYGSTVGMVTEGSHTLLVGNTVEKDGDIINDYGTSNGKARVLGPLKAALQRQRKFAREQETNTSRTSTDTDARPFKESTRSDHYKVREKKAHRQPTSVLSEYDQSADETARHEAKHRRRVKGSNARRLSADSRRKADNWISYHEVGYDSGRYSPVRGRASSPEPLLSRPPIGTRLQQPMDRRYLSVDDDPDSLYGVFEGSEDDEQNESTRRTIYSPRLVAWLEDEKPKPKVLPY